MSINVQESILNLDKTPSVNMKVEFTVIESPVVLTGSKLKLFLKDGVLDTVLEEGKYKIRVEFPNARISGEDTTNYVVIDNTTPILISLKDLIENHSTDVGV